MTDLSIRANRVAALKAAAQERILILDGSWGVMFQKKGLSEADYRAERFAAYNGQMKGNNDILCLTRPDLVAELHDAYFSAGAEAWSLLCMGPCWPCEPSTVVRAWARAQYMTVQYCTVRWPWRGEQTAHGTWNVGGAS